ncbi:MAG TPA: hypothetical protein VJ299_11345 [Steroidobacteraceae bacterium]|jgi:hypothetical protein|nr:hypothetical protein [Steroidobacteraceae bacterium]
MLIDCVRVGLALIAAWLMTPSSAEAATAYWRCSLDRLTVITNGSAARCERLIRTTARYEQLLIELTGWDSETTMRPLTLYSLIRADARQRMFTEKQLAEQARTRSNTYSKYLPGPELNVAAIIDEGGDESLQSVLFIYGQALLAESQARSYPLWYQLGIANLLNGAIVRPDGTVLLNRKQTFAARVEDNQRASQRLDLPALLAAEGGGLSPADFNEVAKRAHMWAQFGLLTTEERRSQYRELALLMRQGTTAAEAVPDVFGMPLEALTELFASGAWQKDASWRLAPRGAPAEVLPAAPLEGADLDAQLGALAARVAEFPDI